MKKSLIGVAAATAVLAGAVARPAGAQVLGATPTYPGRYPYTAADIAFMSGMIHHHAQAVVMAGWAKSHKASSSLQILCARIITGQGAEIELMQRWLRDRRQPIPDVSAKHDDMKGMPMPGMTMGDTLMPGMLTPAQMDTLNRARGVEFDRYFLTYMIQHHTGAIHMVDVLFSSPGAGQDDVVFKFATAVNADQTTEIDRMTQMLDALPSEGRR